MFVDAELQLESKAPYAHKKRFRKPLSEVVLTEAMMNRFWSKVDKSDDCWLFTGGFRDKRGYGSFSIRGKMYTAHRVAFYDHYGYTPNNVLHRCNVENCVRYDHLYDGTPKQNAEDRELYDNSYHPKGEECRSAKLTEHKVVRIRSIYSTEGLSTTDIAKLFKLNSATVNRIIKGVTWKHVKEGIISQQDFSVLHNDKYRAKCKMTFEKVAEMRSLHATGEYSQSKLGKLFGVSQSVAGDIVNRVTWRDIDTKS